MKRPTISWIEENYTKREVMVPMRDGVSLYTAVYSPVGEGKHPILMIRTPFPLKPYGEGRMASNLRESLAAFAMNKYIIVQQNVRGTYLSEGDFVNVRPPREAVESLIPSSEMTDTYDTVDWLLANTQNNGSVGVKGMSYPGFYANCAALCGHPAIKAVSPQAPVTDWFVGDDLHHNGALMLSDTYHFGRFFFRKRPHPGSRILPTVYEPRKDVYKFFLKKGPISSILGPLAKRRTFFKDIVTHPNYDDFWKSRNMATALSEAETLPAMLVVGGSFDAEDCYGPLECFRAIGTREDTYLVLGPWAHGAWGHDDFDHLADASLRPGLTEYFMEAIEYPFFAHYLEEVGNMENGLRDKQNPTEGQELRDKQDGPNCSGLRDKPFDLEKVQIFPSEAVSHEKKPARSRWKNSITETLRITSDKWPLEGTTATRFYLTESKKLAMLPQVKAGSLSYISNPLRPVPAAEPGASIGRDYMAADQKFASRRKDVLTFRGPKAKSSLAMVGPVKASLWISADSTDADIVVKLIDVRPDGYQMLVRGDIMPLRFRNSLTRPEPLKPGKPTHIEFTLNDIAHVLKPGHKLMVQVQSSWYPLFAMNPQKFLKNPYQAEAKDYRPAEITLLAGSEYNSYIEVTTL